MAGERKELVAVATASGEVDAGMMQGLLKDAGIPSVQERMAENSPFGLPALNPGGGERRILVKPEDAERAREVIEAFT